MFQLPFNTEDSKFQEYIKGLGSKDFEDIKHRDYDAAVNHAMEIAVHAVKDPEMDNPKARDLIRNMRPNEVKAAFEYRVANYRQITLAAWEKVLNTLYNIYNPRLTAIHFPEMDRGISSTLEKYVEEEALFQWFKETAFETAMRDANAVIAVLIRENTTGANDTPEPEPMIFESEQVIDYQRGRFYLLEAHTDHAQAPNATGRVFVAIDSEKYVYYIEVDRDGEKIYLPEEPILHGCDFPPVVHMPGKKFRVGRARYNLSYLSGVLPNWNEALVVKSDYQAVRTRNAFPKFWQFKIKCPKCGGQGKNVSSQYKGKNIVCGECEGTGLMKAQGPGDVVLIDSKMAEAGIRDPGGYIEPNPELIKYLAEDYEREVSKGLAAVNMDHLSKDTNIQESGEAKKVGRTDLNTFMQQVADGVYSMQEEVIYFVAKIRYSGMITGRIEDYLPTIERPKTFDVKTPEEHAAAVKMGRDAGLSHSIIAKSELDYVRKEHGEDTDIYKRLQCKLDLDPLPGLAPENAIQIETDTRREDRWLHFNLDRLIGQAVDENPAFFILDRAQKLAILYGFVAAELQANQPAVMPTGNAE